jgi:DHA2 family multidrug resistance protein-like MFS transporter
MAPIPRNWLGLAVIALPCAVYAMDLTVLNLAVPAVSADLQPSSTQLLWIVDSYGFLVAGLLITMGALGDRVGRRRVLLVGAAGFGVVSVLAAYAPTAETLIAARAALGVAGATLAPSTLALIRTMFDDPRQRTIAISVWISSFSTGAAIGPLVGGLLLEHFWWGAVFLPAVPVMVLVLVLGPRLLPEYRDPAAGRLDPISALLGLLAVLAVIYGLKQAAQGGIGWAPAAAVLAGLVLGAAFLRRQRRLPDPLIDLRLFRVPAFSAALAAYTLGFFVNFGSLLFVSQYLQLVLGLSPLAAGAWTVPSAAGFVLGSLLTPRLLRAAAPGPLTAAGLLLAAAGAALLTLLDTGPGPATVVAGSVIISLGLSAVFTVATDLVVAAAPPRRAGAASAISETGSELGGALGIAVLGAVAAAVYRLQLAEPLPGGRGLDVTVDTLGAAVATAGSLPATQGELLLDAARAAFVDGFQVAAALSAAVLLATAALAWRRLREAEPDGAEPDGAEPSRCRETSR